MGEYSYDAIDDLVRERDTALRQRDEARAVLAPLLGAPLIENRCRCCEREVTYWDRTTRAFIDLPHEPDCPVLRRDDLLGRRDDAAPGAARPPEEGA